LSDTTAPLFSMRTTALLLLALVIPYGTKLVAHVEPFPAMIFPDGSGTVPIVDGGVRFGHVSLRGYGVDGQTRALEAKRVLAPIPSHYLYAMAANAFGQSDSVARDFSMFHGRLRLYAPRHRASPAEKEEARAWLADRLRASGVSADKVVLRFDTVTVDRHTGRELARRTDEERVLALR
jgi:hypothetical protein